MAIETDVVLSIENLTIDLPHDADRKHAVEALNLKVCANEIVCVVGESGSGKSITSFATMGLLPKALHPSSGRILFEGEDLLLLPEKRLAGLRGSRMSMIFQEPMTALNPCFTVGNQINEVFAAHSSLSAAQRRKRTLSLLTEVQLAEPQRVYDSFPHQLSGGQRQRIVIALALAMDPALLIADEPTTALDVTTQAQILKLLKELREKHSAGILFVTHDFDVVADIADRVVVMQHGKVVEEGSVSSVLENPNHPYSRQLISSVPPRRPPEPARLQSDQVALSVRNISKTFVKRASVFRSESRVEAVKPISFDVMRGETMGIVGESGSGKSTLVKCLVRLLDPDDGKIILGGNDLAALSKRSLRQHRNQIQIIFQDPYGSLNPRRSIGEQLIEGAVNFGQSRSQAMKRAAELMQIVKLDQDVLNRYPVQFSGGQRQRLCIARALMVDPQILIADEAVSALDVSVQKEVLTLLSDIRDKMGLTMIFITHDLRVAAQVSDRIIVMSKGEAVERGTAREIFEEPRHDYTRRLLAAMPGQSWAIPRMLEMGHSLT